jgi:uncharacterized protein involved in oxidation of intracellular sulfur
VNTLFIINDPPYGTERAHNALRLAHSLAQREGVGVQVFLIGDGASCAKRGQQTPNGYYNLERMLTAIAHHGGDISVCGTCMDARGSVIPTALTGRSAATSISSLTGRLRPIAC